MEKEEPSSSSSFIVTEPDPKETPMVDPTSVILSCYVDNGCQVILQLRMNLCRFEPVQDETSLARRRIHNVLGDRSFARADPEVMIVGTALAVASVPCRCI